MRNICTNKVMDYLTDDMNVNANEDSDIGNYFIESLNILNERIRIGLPVPFALNENKNELF